MSIILTGIKPTGTPHLGNYLGAIKPAIELANQIEGTFFFFIADYHALTYIKDPKVFSEYVYEVAATWLACGLDPEKVILYKQSDISEIFELNWILACNTPKGDLNRAHAYKASVAENEGTKDLDHGINTGLFTYPVLMAADILLFQSNIVPVGKDQIQHVEIARSIAQRINQKYGEIFTLPQEQVKKDVQTIIGLDGQKMSKSYSNTIPLFCAEKKLKKLTNKIKTDSTPENDPKDPDGALVVDYFKQFSSAAELEIFKDELKKGLSWGLAKAKLFEVINREIKDKRDKYNELINDHDKIDSILKDGACKAKIHANKNIKEIRKKIIGQ